MTRIASSGGIREAAALFRSGALSEAESSAQAIIGRDRRSGDALALLGLIAYARGRFEEAAAWHRQAIGVKRKEPLYYCNLGAAHLAREQVTKALACYEKALKLDPRHPKAIEGMADVLERRGKRERAAGVLEPFIAGGAATPRMAVLHARIALGEKKTEGLAGFIEGQLKRREVQGDARRQLLLSLGHALDREGEYERAFEAYGRAKGTEVEYRGMKLAAPAFDAALVRGEFELLREVFSRGALKGLARARGRSELPVFIVGMPRSGSTLVEQIIHAHPQAHGAGETAHLDLLVHQLPAEAGIEGSYPKCMGALKAGDLDGLAGRYLEALRRRSRSALRIGDKSLENFRHLGLISLLPAGSRVIHCRRHPLDVCFSCYMADLSPQLHPYSTDLRDLGAYYREYARLMAFWRENLDLPLLEVDYERVVSEQEAVSREIMEFLELEWDDRCLRFHEAKRDVSTLSYRQVRQPVYGSSVGRWKRYERFLGPLRSALGDVVPPS